MMQMQDRVGQQFGNYRLTQLIGTGGTAEVYLAENTLLKNLRYAIKVMTGTSLSPASQEEFLFEARTVANLQNLNPHIVQIYDVGIRPMQKGEESGIPYLVMEYAPLGTLRSLYSRDTVVPLERIVLYTKQMAEALQCAHSQQPSIVHRDVKPENMLLRNRDHVLLSDFGIATTGNTGPLTIAKEVSVFGTAAYIAPERFSKHTRRASDQYSLAIVVYEWLCGSRPFDGTDQEVCFKQLRMEPPPLHPTYPHITREIQAVVMRALKKNPEDRYPTVLEFAQALEEAVQSALHQNQHVWPPMDTIAAQPAVQTVSTVIQQPKVQVQLPVIPASLTAVPTALPGVRMGPPAVPAQPLDHQQHLKPAVPLDQDSLSTVKFDVRWPIQQTLPAMTFTPTPITRPLQGIREFFDFAPQFATDYRYSFFRNFGIVLNVISAIIIGLLLRNIYVPFAALLFSYLMFALCIRAVEEILALFFGILVALYWGVVGWVIGSYIASSLHANGLSPYVVGFVFFCVSFGLHFWYVGRKNS